MLSPKLRNNPQSVKLAFKLLQGHHIFFYYIFTPPNAGKPRVTQEISRIFFIF